MNDTQQLLVFVIYYIVAASLFGVYARSKNRTLAWAFLGPLFCLPALVALALVSYLCPKCHGPVAYNEWTDGRCPRCGRFRGETTDPRPAVILFEHATMLEVNGDIQGAQEAYSEVILKYPGTDAAHDAVKRIEALSEPTTEA